MKVKLPGNHITSETSKRVGLRPQKETTPDNLAFHGFKQKTQLKHETETDYQLCLNIGLWEGDMLHASDLEEESLSLPWSLTQQLSYSYNRSSTLEIESCWLFGELLLSQIVANNSTKW